MARKSVEITFDEMAKILKMLVVLFVLAGSAVAVSASPSAGAVQQLLGSDPDRVWDVADVDADTTHTGSIRALVWDFEEYRGRMYVSGKFLNVVAPDGSTRNQPYLAAFDVASGAWIGSFRPQLDAPIYALGMTRDGRLLAGGEVDGGIVSVDPVTGALDPGFDPQIELGQRPRAIFDIDVVGKSVYVGGRFARAQGVELLNLGKFDTTTGAVDRAWTPRAEFDTGTPRFGGQLVYGVEVDAARDRVYVTGKFGSISGNLDAAYFATLDETTGVPRDDVPQGLPPETLNHRESFSMWQHDVQFRGDKVYVGGQGHQTLILNADDLSPTHSFFTNQGVGDKGRGGDTQAMFLGKTTLWAGCHCWGSVGPYEMGSYNSDNASGLQSFREYTAFRVAFRDENPFGQQRVRGGYGIDIASGELSEQAFNLNGQGGAWAIHEDNGGRLWMGGEFTKDNGRVGNGLARFSPVGADDLGPVGSCSVSAVGDAVTVSWGAAPGASQYVVYRTVNGSRQYWRGVTSELSFGDTLRDGDIEYFVASKRGGETADVVACGDGVAPPAGNGDGDGDGVATVGSCAASAVGEAVTVSWGAAANASQYVVYRTVDGSPQYWRGLTASRSFDDTLRAGTVEYFVASRDDAELTTPTACSNKFAPPAGDELAAVAACKTAVAGDAVTVSWGAAANASQYVVYRTVDGSPQYWRGLTASRSFDDTLRDGDIDYFVASRQGSQRTTPTACS